MEGRLDQSPHIKKHIPRGELIELLSKALLYSEVEAHWKGDELSTNCSVPFSLLDPHACSLQPHSSTNNIREPSTAKVNGDTAGKRKATTPSEDARAEKRARKEQDEKDAQMNVDGVFIPLLIPLCPQLSQVHPRQSQNRRMLSQTHRKPYKNLPLRSSNTNLVLLEHVLVLSGFYWLTRLKCASIHYSRRPVHDLFLGFRCRVESCYKRPASLWVCFLWC